jgi:hypothetical protein
LRLQRYGEKKLSGPNCNFWKWLGVYLKLFSKIRGSSWNFVDCGLILNTNRGLFAKWHGIIGFELFSKGKKAWTRSTARGPWAAPVHGGPRTGPWRWLARAHPSGRSVPRWHVMRVAMWSGRRGAIEGPLTRAWTTMKRWHTGGGTSAPSDDGAGIREEGRRRGEGVRCSTGVWAPFIGPGGRRRWPG